MVAVGKECIVRDINIVRVRPRGDDLTQYREAAEAGIEQENRRRRCHPAILADPALPFSCFDGSGSRRLRTRARMARTKSRTPAKSLEVLQIRPTLLAPPPVSS